MVCPRKTKVTRIFILQKPERSLKVKKIVLAKGIIFFQIRVASSYFLLGGSDPLPFKAVAQ